MFSNLLLYETPTNYYFTIFTIEIRFYGVCIVLGMLLASLLSMLLMRRRNISSDIILLLFVVVIPCAIIGARLFSVISEGQIQNFFQFKKGGLSIMGGLIGGIGSAIIFALIKKWDFLRLADCVLPTVPLAQAIGRWGNYFNQEVYGGVVTDPSLQFFPFAVKITNSGWSGATTEGVWHYAFFFYEGLANTIWFVVLFLLAWNLVKKPNGLITGLFCLFYGALRAVMEPLRDDQFKYGNGTAVDSSMVMSYILIGIGVCLIAFVLIRNFKQNGKLFGSKEGDPYAVTTFIPSEKKELPLYCTINVMTKLIKQGKIQRDWLEVKGEK